jgi:hypothetical protein
MGQVIRRSKPPGEQSLDAFEIIVHAHDEDVVARVANEF